MAGTEFISYEGALPDEIIRDILSRLPARQTIRFQYASQNWRKATASPEFLKAFLALKPALPLVVYRTQVEGGSPSYGGCGPSYGGKLEVLDVVAAEPERRRAVINFDNRLERVVFSCDGLLIISPRSSERYVLINPSTRQAVRLGQLGPSSVDALYPANDGEDYRVLFHTGGRQPVHMVITIGTGEPPRQVELLASRRQLYPPVLFQGSLHWLSSKDSTIVVFDTISELCREMTSPTTEFWARVFEIKNSTLGVSLYSEERKHIQLWIARDCTVGIWELRFTISLNQLEQKPSDPSMYHVLSENGDVLLFCPGCAIRIGSGGNVIQEVQFPGYDPIPAGFAFKENIRMHAFFDKKRDKDTEKDYSNLFQGL